MKRVRTVAILVAAIALIWGILTFFHWNALRGYDKTKIAENVLIGDVDVSGLTLEQADQALSDSIKEIRQEKVKLKVKDKSTEVTLKDLGLTIKDRKELAKQALAVGSKGTVNQRYRRIRSLKKEPYVIPYTYGIKEKRAAQTLDNSCEPLMKSPENATVMVEGKKLVTVPGKEGNVVNDDETIKALRAKVGGDWNKKGFSLKVTTKKANPKVTEDDLKDIKDELGSFETSYYGSDEGRATNIEVGVSYINGTLLQPGEEFSTDGAMRPYTEERGFKPAASYENGDVVESMGGGICQISTTLYNAVLYAELEVTQRQPHSMRVGYVKAGRDAAIADDVKDFKFKNNTDHPVYIYGHAEKESLTFSIYGTETRPKNREIRIDAQTVKTTGEIKTRYVASTDPLGSMYISKNGAMGLTAKLVKTVIVDGVEQEKEELNTTVYNPADTIISVGTSSSNAAAVSLVANAIATQNDAAIKSAIAKARSLQ